MFRKTKRVFLDYASATPMEGSVIREMKPYLKRNFHNASSLYEEGVFARKAVESARKRVAQIVQSKPSEVIFTGSGTESNNLAILGATREILKNCKRNFKNFKPHIITTNVEHVAVLESFRHLEKEGFSVTYLSVDENGLIRDEDVARALTPETILVSVMLANNEIGTIFPVRQIGVVIDRYKKSLNRIETDFPYLHTDASQAPNYLDVNLDRLNVDLMSLDGSKIYGPKGIGCLIAKSYVPIQSILYGGSHESGIRPGTENVPQIVGFTRALEITEKIREKESARLAQLQKYFFDLLIKEIPQIVINGDTESRLPNNINVCVKGLNSEFAVIQLDDAGVACAAMTACKNLSGEGSSYVVAALGQGCDKSSIRFTMGRQTGRGDIDRAVKALKEIIRLQGLVFEQK